MREHRRHTLAGGHLGAMYQPLELLMIGGAAIGAFVVGNSGKTIKATLKAVPSLFQGSKYPKPTYMELMALLYEILDKTRKESLLERDIESPKDSPLFKKYPKVIKDHHMIEFITDYLRLMVSGKLNAIEIEALMDREIDKGGHHGCAWKIAYADFVTAMMAFFLLMWLIGSTAEGDRKGIAEYFQTPLRVALAGGSSSDSWVARRAGRGDREQSRCDARARLDARCPECGAAESAERRARDEQLAQPTPTRPPA